MYVKIHKVPGDGNCFYHAICAHLSCMFKGTARVVPSVHKLREQVAKLFDCVLDSKNKSFSELRSYAMFYIQDANMTRAQYKKGIKTNMWAGPLEAILLSKILRLRIQVFSKSDLKRSQKERSLFVIKSEPLIDAGDKRRIAVALVLYGYDAALNMTGCHFDALF